MWSAREIAHAPTGSRSVAFAAFTGAGRMAQAGARCAATCWVHAAAMVATWASVSRFDWLTR